MNLTLTIKHTVTAIIVTGALTLGTAALAASESTVIAIQETLAAMGYDPGSADGVAGSNTERAIKAFQGEFGYVVTGEPSDALLDQINSAAAGGAASPERLLAREGLLRSYARAVQQGLAKLGFDPGPVDGAVGPMTREAIRAYQTSQGVAVTGEISKPLLASINTASGL
ncbi:MAG: peptidoglycan-binding domain-containing protein [Alphaproteobacteria bacterium]|jgi:peptidoglycan hydrolase-like protein with peptidoglycan-binding domain|nr:peptidoglycan-binding protein [Rhodospirillaceae bacterium]MDG2483332.1 peptidoglycan-binding domain-containing protein [Alphaproteobacteria bacterium]MBT6204254.1 peptidoglycan-binding protein [Rhodospirillaceae bacterium]MBT6511630.1 peptidoglycan-binding protein [Rhodospirillaceae bacterium]MBT7612931.1 peptidoglycan-binding protein [Rhodospirillaceae bacterium]